MNQEMIDDIYATMTGTMEKAYCVPGVENAFAPGSFCDACYTQMSNCRQRIWDRLGDEDDEDVERMICAMEAIQQELCRRMFEYGIRFGK